MMTADWDVISKKVYWDRDVPLERWREKVSIGHRSYLPDAISTMTPAELLLAERDHYGFPSVILFIVNCLIYRITLMETTVQDVIDFT